MSGSCFLICIFSSAFSFFFGLVFFMTNIIKAAPIFPGNEVLIAKVPLGAVCSK